MTIARVEKALSQFRQEYREDRKADRAETEAALGRIEGKLDVMNGTQRDHGGRLIAVEHKQQVHSEQIATGLAERGTLFKMVRSINIDRARTIGYTTGAVAVSWLFLQFILAPAIKYFLGG